MGKEELLQLQRRGILRRIAIIGKNMTYVNRYIHSVLPSSRPLLYPPNRYSKKDDLEAELRKNGLAISLHETLKGGFFAQVYAATLDGKAVVVKHVGSITPFDPTEFYIPDSQFLTDVKVLRLLQHAKTIRVPGIIATLPKIRTVILEDMRQSDFVLMNDQILQKKLTLASSQTIGTTLALLAQESRKWKKFATNESAEQSMYERGFELRMLYPNSQTHYLSLEKEFVGNDGYFCWPDGHPKNVFVDIKGNVSFIDFGRSHWSDQRYMLPNFLAHIVVYALAGYVEKDLAKEYIREAVKAYQFIETIDEPLFCQYLAMEVLHRAAGKWVAGITTKEQKLALYDFGLTVFDEKRDKIDKLLS